MKKIFTLLLFAVGLIMITAVELRLAYLMLINESSEIYIITSILTKTVTNGYLSLLPPLFLVIAGFVIVSVVAIVYECIRKSFVSEDILIFAVILPPIALIIINLLMHFTFKESFTAMYFMLSYSGALIHYFSGIRLCDMQNVYLEKEYNRV